MQSLPRFRIGLVGLVAAAGLLVACSHDWASPGDAADASDDAAPADDAVPPEDAPVDEATDAFHDEFVPEDAPVDETSDVGPDEAGPDDAGPDDAPEETPVDVPPDCPAPVGHDEDGDGIDDGCDNCPTYVNLGQTDEDFDGLGDACEEPGRPDLFSSIFGFDPFLSSSSAHGLDWEVWQGTWTAGDDFVAGSAVPTGGNYWWTTPVDEPLAVESQFRFAPDVGSGQYWACVMLGLAASMSGTPGYFWDCCFGYHDRSLSIWHMRTGSATLDRLADAPAPVEAVAYPRELWRRLRVGWDGSRLRCTLDTGATLSETSSVELVPPVDFLEELTRGMTAIRVYNGTAEFRSFAVYR